jgi:hypothetical protein
VLLSPDKAQDYYIGRIGRDRVCLLQMGLYDVAKHEMQKQKVSEPTVVTMTRATTQTKFTVYEAPDLAVDLLTDLQYAALIREHHSAGEWNRILLAIKEGVLKTNRSSMKSTCEPLESMHASLLLLARRSSLRWEMLLRTWV